jgi:tetratricopeptide (TPR) repeat protein
MTDENTEGHEQPNPLAAERERLRKAGYTDAEISQILIAKATGGAAAREGLPQGALSHVIGSIVAVGAYVAGLFTSIPQDVAAMLDASLKASARSRAFVSILLKAVVIGVLSFAAWQEWQQHIISQTEIAHSQAQKIKAEADNATRLNEAQVKKLESEAAVSKEVNEAQAQKLRAEAGAAQQVAAGEKAKACSEQMKLMTENMYPDDFEAGGNYVKAGSRTARMMEKYNRDCGAVTGNTPEAPAQSPAEAQVCADNFDALFSKLQKVDKKDTATFDLIGVDLFIKHKKTCPFTSEQQAKLDTMKEEIAASSERIKVYAGVALIVRYAEDARKEFKAGHYDAAYDLEKKSRETAEEMDTKNGKKPGKLTAGALASLAWYALFARDYGGAIDAADRAIALDPPELVAATNKAHALMFLGRDEEARTAYLAHRGEKIDDKRAWNEVIVKDFADLRAAGLSNPLMDEVARALTGAAVPVAAADTPASKTAPATFDNYDIAGNDLEHIASDTLEACISACSAKEGCHAVTFNKWNRKCFLKSGPNTLLFIPAAITAFLDPNVKPTYSDAPKRFLRYPGRGFPRTGPTTSADSAGACEDKCQSTDWCAAETFFRSSHECMMLRTTSEYFPNSDADSGAKRQTN